MDKKINRMAYGKILLGILMFSMVAFSFVSATEWDNIKDVNTTQMSLNYPTITIKNWLGLGSDILTTKITSHTFNCITDCSSIQTINLYQDTPLIEDIMFKDKSGKEINIPYTISIVITEKYTEKAIDYDKSIINCEKDYYDEKGMLHGGKCNNDYVYKDIEKEREVKIPYKIGEVMPKGDYKLEIDAVKSPSQQVDYIYKTNGKWLDEMAWWDASWQKKKRIDLNVTYTANINKTSTLIPVTFDADMKADFGDIRFVDSTEATELGYWFYNNSCVASTSCNIWVNTGDLVTTSNKTIYIYYGNAGVSTTSNIDKAFTMFADDFNGSAVDWGRWTSAGHSKYSTASGNLVALATSTANELYSANAYNDYIWERRISTTNMDSNGFYTCDEVAQTFSCAENIDNMVNIFRLTINSGTSNQGIPTSNTWYKYKTTFPLTSNIFENITSEAGANLGNFGPSASSAGTTRYLGFLRYTGTSGSIDWLYVRRYVPTEPIVVFGAEESATILSVSQSYPVNYSNFSTGIINIGCNYTADGQTISSINISVYDESNNLDYQNSETGLALVSYNKTWTTSALADGRYNWSCSGYGNGGVNASSGNWTFLIDTTPPTISITDPTANPNAFLNKPSLYLNYTVADAMTSVNSCWYALDGGANNSLLNCGTTQNVTTFNTTNARHIITFYANDTLNNINSITRSFYIYNYTTYANSITTVAGNDIIFYLTLNGTGITAEYPLSNATLNFNSVGYVSNAPDLTHADGIIITKTLSIPIGYGNSSGIKYPYLWNYNLKNSTGLIKAGATDTKNITVKNISITDCYIEGGKEILNLSLVDEALRTHMYDNATTNVTIELDLVITSKTNPLATWSFSKKWYDNNSVTVCVPNEILNSSTFKIDFTAGYNAGGHVQEFYYLDNGTLDNTNNFNSYTTHSINLHDLSSADSTTFLFAFTDVDGLEIDDAIIHTFRDYIGEGIFREVERSKQDDNGQTHVHLVEEDVIYYFMVTQYGNIIFTSNTYNAKCLATPCEISLSASPTETNWSIIDNEGGQYAVTSDKTTRIVTTTFSIDSSDLVNASVYKVINGNATLVNSTSVTSMSGSLDVAIPLAYGNATYFVAIYRNNSFIKSAWIDMTESGRNYFGTMGAILGGLIVLSMMLMAVSEGAGFIIFTVFALVVVVIMQLVELGWMALISIICAGAIILWKLVTRRQTIG